MNITPATAEAIWEKSSRRFSDEGRKRLLSLPGEPLFLADWERALFVHYEVDAFLLQRELPFALDLWHGKAFVSLVALRYARCVRDLEDARRRGCSSRLRPMDFSTRERM
jgi:hypothetical protein